MTDFSKISTHKTPEESPGFLLWRVSTFWRRAIEGVLKPLDLTHPQFVVLATTAWLTRKIAGKENKAKVTQIEIAKQAGLDANTTSQILRGLQQKGLIERKRKVDERSKHPTLTAKGEERLALALPAVERADSQFFSLVNLETSNISEALRILAK